MNTNTSNSAATLTVDATRLLEALNYNGKGACAFQGGITSESDLRALMNRELGYSYGEELVAVMEVAAEELVAAGLAEWRGNGWLYTTAEGTAAHESLSEVKAPRGWESVEA